MFFVIILGALCRARKIFFHTDAAQAVGKIPVDVNDLKIDLMSISGHKIYGPKGKKKKNSKVNFFLIKSHDEIKKKIFVFYCNSP